MEVEKVLTAVYDEDLENGVFRIPEDIRHIDGGAFKLLPEPEKVDCTKLHRLVARFLRLSALRIN